MPERPMTPDEMAKFEKEVVQHDDTEDDLAPASETGQVQDNERRPAEPAVVPPGPD